VFGGESIIAVGATNYVNSGQWGAVYFYSLSSTGVETYKTGRAYPSGSVTTEYGFSVGAADVDMDGTMDLLVGAIRDSDEGTKAGAVHVILLNSDLSSKGSEKITIPSTGELGSSVTSIGDLNGDGFGDIAVGAKTESVEISNNDYKVGECYLLSPHLA
jgi:hypothetical protein